MYKVNDNLAVHGFDFNDKNYEINWANTDYVHSGEFGYITDENLLRTGQKFRDRDKNIWVMIDCRDISDDENIKTHVGMYIDHILEGCLYLDWGNNIVCCCSAGQSRSNAVALGILMQYFKMNYYDAYELLRAKNPICNIAMHHLDVLKKVYNVT